MTGRQMTLPLHLLYQPGDMSVVTAYTTHQYLEELHHHLGTTFAFAQQQLQKSAEGRKAYFDQKASQKELDIGDKIHDNRLPIACQRSFCLTGQVCVRLDSCDVLRTYYALNTPQTTWAGTNWTREALSHAVAEVTHMLRQLQKMTVTQAELSGGQVSPIQAHLAHSLGSAIPLYIDPEMGDLAFLISLPIIDSNNIYRLKDVLNVGFWQGDIYVKIHTPEMVAYHDSNEQLYLAPNLRMCTLTKDIHYLCPSKVFIRNNTEEICGLEAMKVDTHCPAQATPRSQIETTQEIIGNRWFVNTTARTATLSYNQHDTAIHVTLLNQTMWINIPKGSILHIDDLALYHLSDNENKTELEI
ncbi:hypothetical protein DPX16_12640 [Anabarilius grahami]|uniref:Uncharacterized protein n=1 Tax=Anabarilius grahami TaxID=495550 RepID=A0A3N0YKR2_ANAGA|nr:hypothetical protein DPX16_12640 [Anabarilius grahami]